MKDNNKKHNPSSSIGENPNRFAIPNFSEKFIHSCDNIKLLHDKYIPILDDKYRESVFNKITTIKNTSDSIKDLNTLYKEISGEPIKLTTNSRLIIGLGSGSVLETSIRLHHVYGIPYIPSSSIKGVLRAFNILKAVNFDLKEYKKFEKNIEEMENIDENSYEGKIVKLFGNQYFSGKMTFLDAIPQHFKFEIDIMNVHYKDYYGNAKPPTDNQSPNPIKFLVVEKGSVFNFYFTKQSKDLYKKTLGRDLEHDIKEASEYLGFGGKTAIGYGIFK